MSTKTALLIEYLSNSRKKKMNQIFRKKSSMILKKWMNDKSVFKQTFEVRLSMLVLHTDGFKCSSSCFAKSTLNPLANFFNNKKNMLCFTLDFPGYFYAASYKENFEMSTFFRIHWKHTSREKREKMMNYSIVQKEWHKQTPIAVLLIKLLPTHYKASIFQTWFIICMSVLAEFLLQSHQWN